MDIKHTYILKESKLYKVIKETSKNYKVYLYTIKNMDIIEINHLKNYGKLEIYYINNDDDKNIITLPKKEVLFNDIIYNIHKTEETVFLFEFHLINNKLILKCEYYYKIYDNNDNLNNIIENETTFFIKNHMKNNLKVF